MAPDQRDPLEKLSAEINRIMDERESRQRIKDDPKAAGAELATDLREFLGEWKAAKAAKAAGGGKPRVVKPEDEDDSIFGGLFGGGRG